jgi:hypothetical protein
MKGVKWKHMYTFVCTHKMVPKRYEHVFLKKSSNENILYLKFFQRFQPFCLWMQSTMYFLKKYVLNPGKCPYICATDKVSSPRL